MKITVLVLALLVGVASAAGAVTNIFGMSGLIETPNADVLDPGSFAITANSIADVGDTDVDFTTVGAGFGLLPQFEVSGAYVDTDVDEEFFLNGKYLIVPETFERPAIAVGVVDVLDEFDVDPSFFVVFGKNITAAAEEIAGMESKPLRGTVGFGTGIYEGIFAGLEWALSPRFDIMAEYLTEGIGADSTFNAGLEFSLTENLTVEAGLYDFDDFYFGGTYTVVPF